MVYWLLANVSKSGTNSSTFSNCNVSNWGQTFPSFLNTAGEYMGISNLIEKRVKNIKPAAVSKYVLECDCSIDFSNFIMLALDASKFNPA